MALSWTEVSAGRWERPADGLESYFIFTGDISAKFSDSHQHYTLFSTLDIVLDLPDATPALKDAWKQMRYDHPQIATWVEGMTKVYMVPDKKALDEWMTSTFITSVAADAEELYKSVGFVNQGTLYWLPKSSQVVIRVPHCTIDGTGVLMFWHCFLSALADPTSEIEFGNEPARLAPTIAEVLGQTIAPTPQQLEHANALFMSYASRAPGIGPTSKVDSAPAGHCRQTELVFSVEMTEAVIRTCHSRGFSVTSAIHAAYIGTMVQLADPATKLDEYVSMNQFNLRRYLPKPQSSSEHVVGIYYTSHPYHINLPVSYAEAVKSLHKYYHTTYEGNPAMIELTPVLTNVMCGAVQTPEFQASPIPKDALVSSLGVTEQYLQRAYGKGITVKDVGIGVDVVLGMSMLFVHTFRDQLRLTYSFNDGYQDPEDIQKLLETVQEILQRELLG